MVATGGIINNQEYIGLVERLTDILGNGSGQQGYGQRVLCSENFGGIAAFLFAKKIGGTYRGD